MFDESRVNIGGQQLLDILLRVGENELHGRESCQGSRLDVGVHPFHHGGWKVQLSRRFHGGEGTVDLGHGLGQFVEKGHVSIDLRGSIESAMRVDGACFQIVGYQLRTLSKNSMFSPQKRAWLNLRS